MTTALLAGDASAPAAKGTRLSTRELLCWVIAFFVTATLCMVVRKALDGKPVADLVFNAVEMIAWGCALLLVLRDRTAVPATAVQVCIVVVSFACAIVLPGRFSIVALLPIGLALMLAPGWSDGQRRAGAVFFAIAAQRLFSRIIPILFGDIILKLDTAAAGVAMQVFLPGSTWSGNLLKPSQDVGVTVLMGCSSFANLSAVMLCFLSLHALDGGRLTRRAVGAVAIVSLVVIAANTARLIAIASSLESYRYWHNGDGALYFAIGLTALTIGLCSTLSRWAATCR